MNDKKKSTGCKLKPEHTIRCGEVIAAIFRRQAHTGYVYRDFTLTRRWSSQATEKESHGNSFFDGNEGDLLAAIKAASDHIREKNGSHGDHAPEDPVIDDSIE